MDVTSAKLSSRLMVLAPWLAGVVCVAPWLSCSGCGTLPPAFASTHSTQGMEGMEGWQLGGVGIYERVAMKGLQQEN